MRLALYTIVSFFALGHFSANAQCIVSAGPDIHWCRTINNADTLQFQSSILAGAAPIRYSWSIDPIIISGNLTFHASIFLSDTTASNPKILDSWGPEMTFYLEATDANGMKCRDSVSLTTSQFAEIPMVDTTTIFAGDSIRLLPPNVGSVYGGPSADSVVWRPNEGLNDSNAVRPWAKPGRSVVYRCKIWDSAGCSQEGSPFQYVFVSYLNDDSSPIGQFGVYPNTLAANQTNRIAVEAPKGINKFNLTLFDVSGSLVYTKSDYHFAQSQKLRLPPLRRGIYYLRFSSYERHSNTVIKILVQ